MITLDDLKPSVCKKDRYGYVYLTIFTRPTDGHRFYYIGQHVGTCLDRRYSGSGLRLSNLIRKYGRAGNTRLLIVAWASDYRQLDELERFFIINAKAHWKTDCINLAFTTEFGLHGPETRAKIARSLKKRLHDGSERSKESQQRRLKTLAWNMANVPGYGDRYRHSHTEITRAQISASLRGKPKSEETKRRMREGWARRRARIAEFGP